MDHAGLAIRRASGRDAAGIAAVWTQIASERIYSAVDKPWPVEEQRAYLESRSPREATHVAIMDAGEIVGFQSLDLHSPILNSMAHVAQVGTFIMPGWRGRGIGKRLWLETQAFARSAAYTKIVIQVRASNPSAQSFYRSLGFVECGRLTRQVIVDGQSDDEILMELFL
jgi:ribosomal protein S18 acetylase RimI-like enzyme